MLEIEKKIEEIDEKMIYLKKFLEYKRREFSTAKNPLHILKLENTIIELESEVKALKSAKLAYETVLLYLSKNA
jgi:TATA-binding protein-associated factor Taf7